MVNPRQVVSAVLIAAMIGLLMTDSKIVISSVLFLGVIALITYTFFCVVENKWLTVKDVKNFIRKYNLW